MLHHLASLPLAPLLMLQGRRVRASLLQLPEADGPRRGVSGSGPPLKLMIVGDSSAAGVGAAHQDEALLGRTVAALAQRYEVDYRLVATSGARTELILRRLTRMPSTPVDVVVTVLGVNDVTAGTGTRRWRKLQRAVIDALVLRHDVGQVIVCGLPPMWGFPALPQPLRWYLGARAGALNAAARKVAAGRGADFLPLDFCLDDTLMAGDGFHPGPAIYAEWGKRLAAMITPPSPTAGAAQAGP
ncbi:MAG: SGNH/GDSL hydrolase family protein, partial [Gammaproteobacteria bacterium]|nr:SGNH/GDSL hydrolase family protein [Gammaproteobacteria bacterium]NNM00890.1 SGNH/GDSL hydrolase family protein [Gammaproteobacteria bacterium]